MPKWVPTQNTDINKTTAEEGHSQNASPNLATASSSFGPYFGECPNLGFTLHESYFISKSCMVHKSFAQMKSNNNLEGQTKIGYKCNKETTQN